jgi:AmmeMemoRadiSam system protein A
MSAPLSKAERAALLDLARRSIEAHLGSGEAPKSPGGASFAEHRGAFVTLKRRADDELRGCIGYAEPILPLFEAVARGAVAAASEDRRFLPVTPSELPGLRIEISALTALQPVKAEDVKVGEHGLVVRRGERRGLLLPQVAKEWGWDRETFLKKTCHKAGLPEDAWRNGETEILAFEAEVFGED